jgi:dolichol-phosphate mannosyltransferase
MNPRQQLSAGLARSSSGSGESAPASVSVVVPAYCEEGNLVALYEELNRVTALQETTWELIIVDDGSTDGSWQQITALHQQDARVKGLKLSRNFGHQYALLAGICGASGEAVITMDADLQHPPEVIGRLLEEWRQGRQIVHTVRLDPPGRSLFKHVSSRLFYRVFAFLSGVELSAGMADFRLLDRQVVDELIAFKEGGLFLRGLVQWVGYSSSKVEFACRDRLSGKTKYSLSKMLKFAWAGVSSFSLIPLRIAIMIGLLTSAGAAANLVYAVYVRLFTDSAVPGWASAVSIVSLLFGVLFILLGVIGEYMGRILDEVRARPRFIVSERMGFDSSNPMRSERSASRRSALT